MAEMNENPISFMMQLIANGKQPSEQEVAQAIAKATKMGLGGCEETQSLLVWLASQKRISYANARDVYEPKESD